MWWMKKTLSFLGVESSFGSEGWESNPLRQRIMSPLGGRCLSSQKKTTKKLADSQGRRDVYL